MRCFVTAAVLGAIGVAGSARAADPNEFLVFNFDRSDNGMEMNSNDLPGRLFIPSSYNPNTPMPVVTFFHGIGERGSNNGGAGYNTSQVNNNINNLLAAAKSRGFILYAPQAWGGWGGDNQNMAMNQLYKITQQYNVDMSRLYVTGLSNGGGGTFETLSNYPDVFAAAVAICAQNLGTDKTARLADQPLWMFHGTSDGDVNVSVSRNRVNALRNEKELGNQTFPVDGNFYNDGTLRYTEYPGAGHGIWGTVYGTSAVYDWMLDKNRPVPTLQVGETVAFDLGSTMVTTPDPHGREWNSTNYSYHTTTGVVRAFARTTTGSSTTLALEVTDPFAWNTTSADNPIDGDKWAAQPTDPGQLRITGLVPGGAYDVELFASDTANSSTRFIINDVTQDLLNLNNVSNTALFESVIADLAGGITVDVNRTPGFGGAGYLNWLTITAVPEPSTLCLLSLASLTLFGRRRA